LIICSIKHIFSIKFTKEELVDMRKLAGEKKRNKNRSKEKEAIPELV
jgi:hypothetical protein